MRHGSFVLRNAENRSERINIAINNQIRQSTRKHPAFENQAINCLRILAGRGEAEAK